MSILEYPQVYKQATPTEIAEYGNRLFIAIYKSWYEGVGIYNNPFISKRYTAAAVVYNIPEATINPALENPHLLRGYFLGREPMPCILGHGGHMTLDYETLSSDMQHRILALRDAYYHSALQSELDKTHYRGTPMFRKQYNNKTRKPPEDHECIPDSLYGEHGC